MPSLWQRSIHYFAVKARARTNDLPAMKRPLDHWATMTGGIHVSIFPSSKVMQHFTIKVIRLTWHWCYYVDTILSLFLKIPDRFRTWFWSYISRYINKVWYQGHRRYLTLIPVCRSQHSFNISEDRVLLICKFMTKVKIQGQWKEA